MVCSVGIVYNNSRAKLLGPALMRLNVSSKHEESMVIYDRCLSNRDRISRTMPPLSHTDRSTLIDHALV
jgi:hypothetical protein